MDWDGWREGRKEVWISEEGERIMGDWTTGRSMSVERLGAIPRAESGM